MNKENLLVSTYTDTDNNKEFIYEYKNFYLLEGNVSENIGNQYTISLWDKNTTALNEDGSWNWMDYYIHDKKDVWFYETEEERNNKTLELLSTI